MWKSYDQVHEMAAILDAILNFSKCSSVTKVNPADSENVLPWLPKTIKKQESRAFARKPHDAAAVLFGLKFADNIHNKFKSSQASRAMLQGSKYTGTKQNLTQNGDSRSFKVTSCFGVGGKAIRH